LQQAEGVSRSVTPLEERALTPNPARLVRKVSAPNTKAQTVAVMSSLSGKTTDELSRLLDEYGIKHGPIVDSTRKLYEKKLTEAMAKGTKPSSSDKTYYREEEEEITYVTYHPPVRQEGIGEGTRRSRITDYEDEADNAHEPIFSRAQTGLQSSPRFRSTAYTSTSSQQDARPVPAKSEGSKSGGVPGWLRVFVFIIIAVFLYYVYSNMESAEQSPFEKIDA
ncbi:hypothetical protein NFI96_015331, partial [Prochilodus magdalenae]